VNPTTEPETHESAGARIVAITMDDPVLGGPLRLSLGPQRTVLVGRNGAGKSRILESLRGAAFAAVSLGEVRSPAVVGCEYELGGECFKYEYAWTPGPDGGPDERWSWVWNEKCVEVGSGREIWQVIDGTLLVGQKPSNLFMPHMVGLLHIGDVPTVPPQAVALRGLLYGLHLIHAGVPRHGLVRDVLRLQGQGRNGAAHSGPRWTGRGDERLIDVLKTLVHWFETERDRFDAVMEIGRRLQVLRELVVHIKELEIGTSKHPSVLEAEVFVDGVNFGYLSDGTQRLIELVIKLVDPAVTVLLLEEPETSVHPGLLRRLLAELDALGPGKQVVISTHSPMVIDWTRAEDVRLVERTSEGVTSVRSLSADERARLGIYLDDDLALSDFMFSGAMD